MSSLYSSVKQAAVVAQECNSYWEAAAPTSVLVFHSGGIILLSVRDDEAYGHAS